MPSKGTTRVLGELNEQSVRNTSPGTIKQCSNLLQGQSFYLHLPESMHTEKLAKRLVLMGGVIEKFFHKDIKFVIVNERKRARRPTTIHHNDELSMTNQQMPRFETRAQVLFRKVSAGRSLANNGVVESAEKWGIPIKSLSSINEWLRSIEKQLKENEMSGKKTNIRALRGTFLKVEDIHGKFRPLVKEFDVWPNLNFHGSGRIAPFDQRVQPPNKKDEIGHKGSSRKDPQGKSRRLAKPGYCEPCRVEYNDLRDHLQGRQHREYANNETNFSSLDYVVSRGPSIMKDLREKSRKRRKLASPKKVRFSKRRSVQW